VASKESEKAKEKRWKGMRFLGSYKGIPCPTIGTKGCTEEAKKEMRRGEEEKGGRREG
jgi:hypothetical protein